MGSNSNANRIAYIQFIFILSVSLQLVSLQLVSLQLVSLQLVSLQLVSLQLVSLRLFLQVLFGLDFNNFHHIIWIDFSLFLNIQFFAKSKSGSICETEIHCLHCLMYKLLYMKLCNIKIQVSLETIFYLFSFIYFPSLSIRQIQENRDNIWSCEKEIQLTQQNKMKSHSKT